MYSLGPVRRTVLDNKNHHGGTSSLTGSRKFYRCYYFTPSMCLITLIPFFFVKTDATKLMNDPFKSVQYSQQIQYKEPQHFKELFRMHDAIRVEM